MIEFLRAGYPWIILGLFLAVACVWMSKKKQ